MARWVWRLLMLKILELSDTVIFILRKKYNQASFLHIYHHTSTALLSWIACKFVPGKSLDIRANLLLILIWYWWLMHSYIWFIVLHTTRIIHVKLLELSAFNFISYVCFSYCSSWQKFARWNSIKSNLNDLIF